MQPSIPSMATLTDASWLPITKPVVMSEIRFHPLGDAPFRRRTESPAVRSQLIFTFLTPMNRDSLNLHALINTHKTRMQSKIQPGQDYLLDGKTQVRVLKPANRSQTIFNIEIPGQRVESVDADRLSPLPETIGFLQAK